MSYSTYEPIAAGHDGGRLPGPPDGSTSRRAAGQLAVVRDIKGRSWIQLTVAGLLVAIFCYSVYRQLTAPPPDALGASDSTRLQLAKTWLHSKTADGDRAHVNTLSALVEANGALYSRLTLEFFGSVMVSVVLVTRGFRELFVRDAIHDMRKGQHLSAAPLGYWRYVPFVTGLALAVWSYFHFLESGDATTAANARIVTQCAVTVAYLVQMMGDREDMDEVGGMTEPVTQRLQLAYSLMLNHPVALVESAVVWCWCSYGNLQLAFWGSDLVFASDDPTAVSATRLVVFGVSVMVTVVVVLISMGLRDVQFASAVKAHMPGAVPPARNAAIIVIGLVVLVLLLWSLRSIEALVETSLFLYFFAQGTSTLKFCTLVRDRIDVPAIRALGLADESKAA